MCSFSNFCCKDAAGSSHRRMLKCPHFPVLASAIKFVREWSILKYGLGEEQYLKGIYQKVRRNMNQGISFSGLSSGIDTATIIDQLVAIERRPIVLLQNQQAKEETRKEVLQKINTSLLAVKNTAEVLSKTSDFFISKSKSSNSDLVGVSVNGSATPGSFTVEVLSRAQAQARSSKSFSSITDALGLNGDIVVNGKAVSVLSTDSLFEIQSKINSANVGVRAQILKVSNSDHRLLLTSQMTGKEGFDLLDASITNVLQSLGMTGESTSIKNPVESGAKTNRFVSNTTAMSSLLGLKDDLSGTVTIGDKTMVIDLSTQSLTNIKETIDAAAPTGVTTSLESEEVEGESRFRLRIDGSTVFIDANNVLETLGVLEGVPEIDVPVTEIHKSNLGNTINGSTAVSSNSKFTEILGADVANGDTVTISGTEHDGTAVSGVFNITNADSLEIQDLLDKIESTLGNSVSVSVDLLGKITVEDKAAGISQLSISLMPNNEGGGSLNFGVIETVAEGKDAQSREIVTGRDATFRVNGVTLFRPTNTVTDAVEGVTLILNGAKVGTETTISVDQDINAIQDKIETFVSSYNESLSLINSQFVFDEETQTSGPLSGDVTLLTLQAQLRSIVSNPVSGLVSDENNLTLFGISFTRNGDLKIDTDKLNTSLANKLTSMKRILASEGMTSESDVEFVFQTDDTRAGTYDLSISTAANQATVIGSTDLSGGLMADETFTVTDLLINRSASVELKVGDDTDTIVSKLNSALFSSTAEVRLGSIQNTTGGSPLLASTTFSNIDGASVQANDTIDFQGTAHNGEKISGSFKISNPDTQTVADLLKDIRGTFSGSVSTSIDSNGQIIITDNQVGNSELTLALLERNEGGGNLNFGSIDVSVEGRFSLSITASNIGGKLQLSANDYGAGAGFTISQSRNETGVTDDTYNGVDVAGTINGEAAIGKGRVLTGASDSVQVAGLAVRVLLTPTQLVSQGGDQGTVKVTQGVTDQLRRTLGLITDPIQGLIASRERAIDDTIDAVQAQIDSLEQRVILKQNTLIRQFTAMETALAQFNSIGAFLSTQLASLPRLT